MHTLFAIRASPCNHCAGKRKARHTARMQDRTEKPESGKGVIALLGQPSITNSAPPVNWRRGINRHSLPWRIPLHHRSGLFGRRSRARSGRFSGRRRSGFALARSGRFSGSAGSRRPRGGAGGRTRWCWLGSLRDFNLGANLFSLTLASAANFFGSYAHGRNSLSTQRE